MSEGITTFLNRGGMKSMVGIVVIVYCGYVFAAGAFFAATLGVPVYGEAGYALWSMNTYLNPIMAMLVAFLGIGMYKKAKITKWYLL